MTNLLKELQELTRSSYEESQVDSICEQIISSAEKSARKGHCVYLERLEDVNTAMMIEVVEKLREKLGRCRSIRYNTDGRNSHFNIEITWHGLENTL